MAVTVYYISSLYLLVVLLTGDGDFGEKILSLPEIHPGDIVVAFLATTEDLKQSCNYYTRSYTEPPRETTNNWVPTRSDTNQSVQSQKQARSLKFLI